MRGSIFGARLTGPFVRSIGAGLSPVPGSLGRRWRTTRPDRCLYVRLCWECRSWGEKVSRIGCGGDPALPAWSLAVLPSPCWERVAGGRVRASSSYAIHNGCTQSCVRTCYRRAASRAHRTASLLAIPFLISGDTPNPGRGCAPSNPASVAGSRLAACVEAHPASLAGRMGSPRPQGEG